MAVRACVMDHTLRAVRFYICTSEVGNKLFVLLIPFFPNKISFQRTHNFKRSAVLNLDSSVEGTKGTNANSEGVSHGQMTITGAE
jgi:hypothetical protein